MQKIGHGYFPSRVNPIRPAPLGTLRYREYYYMTFASPRLKETGRTPFRERSFPFGTLLHFLRQVVLREGE